MSALVSVIVPVFNTAEFLCECLNSIAAQSYKNLEILLVDDGSTDGSEKICDEFAIKDNRFKVIHKANGGQASARNDALEIFKGEFVTFIDSDDIVDENLIQILYDLTAKFDTKISMCGYKEFSENSQISQILKENENLKISEKISPKVAFKGCFLGDGFYMSGVCRILFSREIFIDLRFPAGQIHEDVAIFCEALESSEIVITRQNLYFYRVRSSSTVHVLSDKFFSIFPNTQKFCDAVVAKFPELKQEADYKMALTYLTTAEKILLPQNAKFRPKLAEFHAKICSLISPKFALKQGNFGKKLVLFYIHPKLFEMVYKIYQNLSKWKRR